MLFHPDSTSSYPLPCPVKVWALPEAGGLPHYHESLQALTDPLPMYLFPSVIQDKPHPFLSLSFLFIFIYLFIYDTEV